MDVLLENIKIVEEDGVRKCIIPDNAYLPFMPVKDTIKKMDVGDLQEWPVKKISTLRVVAMRLKKEDGRKFRIVKSKNNTVLVFRHA